MRAALLILLAINVAVFVWTRWISPASDAAGTPSASLGSVPRLVLASEAPARSAAPPKPAEPPRCVSVGPFLNLEESARAEAILHAGGYETRQRSAVGQVPTGYMVYVDRVKDEAAQLRVQRVLRLGGLRDAKPVTAEDGTLRVSVGVFSERDRARRRAAVVERMGIDVEIAERMAEGAVYWVDLDLKSAADALDIESLKQDEGTLKLSIEACPPPAPDASGTVEAPAPAP